MITRADIEKLAELSRIKIAPEEQESLGREIEAILGYVDQIKKAVQVSAASPENARSDKTRSEKKGTEKGLLYNVLREDGAPHQPGEFTEKILSGAPAREGNYLKVKKIL